MMTQIDGVNLAANSLVESNHPRGAEVKKCQDNLNTRWGVGRAWRWGSSSGTSVGCGPEVRRPAVCRFVPSDFLPPSAVVSF